MPRGVRRPPAIPAHLRPRVERISKSDWIELYRDIYMQLGIEDPFTEEGWVEDAERRLKLLRQA